MLTHIQMRTPLCRHECDETAAEGINLYIVKERTSGATIVHTQTYSRNDLPKRQFRLPTVKVTLGYVPGRAMNEISSTVDFRI